MKSITVHNIDDVLYRRIAEAAAEQNLSLNASIKSTLSDAHGITKKKKKRDLSWMVGLWTKEEGEQFDKDIEEAFEQIDPED